MDTNWVAFGHRYALHLVLERLLVRLYEGDEAGLAELEAECMAAADNMPLHLVTGEGRRVAAAHLSDTLESLFGGARSQLATDE